ncbi:MAG: YfcE family phosphodiesterase [Planctomycetaceae bacterium]|nr:YfcE family phosphodiesterase [Planctomycetaceae bacterium]
MRIAILSDTHDQLARTRVAVRWVVDQGAEALIHCGDLTGPDVVYGCAALPSYYVFGNNDFDVEDLRRAMSDVGGVCLGRAGEVTLAGRRIAVTHGDLSGEMRRLAARSPDYLLFGHTHRRVDERMGPTRRINPGALHRAAAWTVALLDLGTDSLQFLQITNRS